MSYKIEDINRKLEAGDAASLTAGEALYYARHTVVQDTLSKPVFEFELDGQWVQIWASGKVETLGRVGTVINRIPKLTHLLMGAPATVERSLSIPLSQ